LCFFSFSFNKKATIYRAIQQQLNWVIGSDKVFLEFDLRSFFEKRKTDFSQQEEVK
jgi:hypothetical protein